MNAFRATLFPGPSGWGALLMSILLLCAAAVSVSAGADVSGSFEQANRLYEEGKYADAVAAYEKLVQAGKVSAPIWFNFGNALFKSGQLGKAIAAYRQGQQLAPRDPDLLANLQFARNQSQGPSVPIKLWQRWLVRLSVNEWTALAMINAWVVLGLLTIGQLRPQLRLTLRPFVFVLAFLWAVFVVTLVLAWQVERSPMAIVTTPEAVVRRGPLEESQNAFTVHDGSELAIVDRKGDWLEVSIDDRRTGWIPTNKVVAWP